MTRKDFELIARTIKKMAFSFDQQRTNVANTFATALQAHSGNANFDKARFLKACGAPDAQ